MEIINHKSYIAVYHSDFAIKYIIVSSKIKNQDGFDTLIEIL